jgi:glucose/arabinose dehydrogenase/plastocyanin
MKKIIFVAVIILIAGAVTYFVLQRSPGQDNETELTQEVGLNLVAQGFVSPVAFVSAKDGTGRMFLVDQIGVIKVIDSQGQVLDFLDLRNRLAAITPAYDERGLLGLAFHPDFKDNGRFFVYYSAPLRSGAPSGWDHTSVLSEFSVSDNNPNMADSGSEKVILRIDEPQSNHNGGHITFGPDGYLYIPLGDGGQANDVAPGHSEIGNGQDKSTLLGKILRIDIDDSPYSIPQDNPFVGKDGLDEIFAFGFRNPYHISFDEGGSHELFVADVGQNLWEEVDIVTKGNNYGWNIREGKHCFNPEDPDQSPAECSLIGLGGETLSDPVIEYGRTFGVANVGGYVYRGELIGGLKGNYVFADWSKGFDAGDGSLFAATEKDGEWSFRELKISGKEDGRLRLFIKGIGQDEENELYVLTSEVLGPNGTSGKIFKIVPPGTAGGDASAGEQTVLIKNFSFNPSTLTIQAGTKVTWKNGDSVVHTATSQGNFDSGNLSKGEEFTFIFDSAGTFNYICTPHPFMKGKIIVQ